MGQTLEQYRHERKWGRYEEAMRLGKRYRNEKGRELRRERGIILYEDSKVWDLTLAAKDEVDRKARKRFCTVMQEMRLCCGCKQE